MSQQKQEEDTKMEDAEEDQVRRSMRLLREDIDHQGDRIADVARQTIWTMSQQVSQARKEAAGQIVILGFNPSTESANALRAMEERNAWLQKTLAEAANISPDRVRFTASHSTNMENLSRLSLLTFSEPHVANVVLRAVGNKKLQYHGQQLLVKRQVSAWDRIVSIPAKAIMEIVSDADPSLRNSFRPQWKEGIIMNDKCAGPVARWQIDVEHARIKVYVAQRYLQLVEDKIDASIRRLHWGPSEDDSSATMSGKGKHKGKGRGKTKKSSTPLDPQCYKKEAEDYRIKMGNLVISKFPFSISIRLMDAEGSQETGEKRAGEPAGMGSSKRRSPTPLRYDPWAAAASSASASAATPVASVAAQEGHRPPPLPQEEDLKALARGGQISA